MPQSHNRNGKLRVRQQLITSLISSSLSRLATFESVYIFTDRTTMEEKNSKHVCLFIYRANTVTRGRLVVEVTSHTDGARKGGKNRNPRINCTLTHKGCVALLCNASSVPSKIKRRFKSTERDLITDRLNGERKIFIAFDPSRIPSKAPARFFSREPINFQHSDRRSIVINN